MLKVQNLTVRYSDAEAYLFQDLSFQLQTGSLLWIKGPNGCGKTSLLYALSNIIPQHIGAVRQGQILFDEQVLNDIPLPRMLPLMSMVMQNPEWQILFPTVEEEIIYALENTGLADNIIADRLQQSLDRFHLAQYQKANPHHLSAGYQKLLMLCIIDAASPDVMLLDEPLSGLSASHINLVLSWLEICKQEGKIIILTEHNEELETIATHKLCFNADGFLYA